jgi:FlaG/FlaF family flagellin (archaellin)
MKSTTIPSPVIALIVMGIAVVVVAGIVWVKAHPKQEESTQFIPDMSNETQAENLPDLTPSPTPSGVRPEKG